MSHYKNPYLEPKNTNRQNLVSKLDSSQRPVLNTHVHRLIHIFNLN
nr:hypothetical protein [uncultured archaeon]